MRWLALALVLGCGGNRAAIDASSEPARDAAADASAADAADAAADAPIDAPPDAPFSTASPACTTAPTTLVDVSPRQTSNFAIAGNTVYVGVFRIDGTVVDGEPVEIVAGRPRPSSTRSRDSIRS